MRTVAERLVCGVPASAEADHRTPGETKRIAQRIDNFKVALNPDGSVVINRNFRGCHLFSLSN
jgi:hypothetical protein